MQSYKALLTAAEREKQKRPRGLCNGNFLDSWFSLAIDWSIVS